MRMPYFNKQCGVTLIELMVVMAIGLIVLSAATSLIVNIYTSGDKIEKSLLQRQNATVILDHISAKLRRAGMGQDLLFDTMKSTTANNCIIFSYDTNDNGLIDQNEVSGFRHSVSESPLQAVKSNLEPGTASCDQHDHWNDISFGDLSINSLLITIDPTTEGAAKRIITVRLIYNNQGSSVTLERKVALQNKTRLNPTKTSPDE